MRSGSVEVHRGMRSITNLKRLISVVFKRCSMLALKRNRGSSLQPTQTAETRDYAAGVVVTPFWEQLNKDLVDIGFKCEGQAHDDVVCDALQIRRVSYPDIRRNDTTQNRLVSHSLHPLSMIQTESFAMVFADDLSDRSPIWPGQVTLPFCLNCGWSQSLSAKMRCKMSTAAITSLSSI